MINWFACPETHKDGFMCSKPFGHSGSCCVEFSQTLNKKYFLVSKRKIVDENSINLQCTKDELNYFGIPDNLIFDLWNSDFDNFSFDHDKCKKIAFRLNN